VALSRGASLALVFVDTREERGMDRTAERRVAGDGDRCARTGGEPRLEELLDDPIMALLWRRDRLDPAAARAAVLALRALVRGRAAAGEAVARA
jgi:hypothetical protein